LHFFHGVRRNGRGRDALLGLALERRIRVAIERDVLVALEHPLRPDGLFELAERAIEVALGHAAW